MSTLLRTPAVTDEDGIRVVTFDDVRVDDYSPVSVVIRVSNASAWVRVTCQPGGSWWRCPGARLMRRMVDIAIAETGQRRNGTRDDTSGAMTWSFRYTLAN